MKSILLAFALIFGLCSFSSATEYKSNIVMFYTASWCPHCVQMKPLFGRKDVRQIFNDQQYYFVMIDTDKYGQFSRDRGVGAIPVITITEYNPTDNVFGEDKVKHVGGMNLVELKRFLKKAE